MATIVLHNGHLNVDQNPDATLHGSTGAAGECDWIVNLQHNYIGPVLTQRGYQVKFTDGSGPNQDYNGDLFIADHYDGNPGGGRYWCLTHAANDTTQVQSDKLVALMTKWLATLDGQGEGPVDPSKITDNMLYYYGFTYESQPDVIIEHGNGPDTGDYEWLHTPDNMSKIAIVMADAIDEYFGVKATVVTTIPTPYATLERTDADAIVTLSSVLLDQISSMPDSPMKGKMGFEAAEIKRKMGATESRFSTNS